MQQGDDYDDDYYDDDDDYYDDDEGGGPSPLVLVVVGVALLMGLGAAGLAGYILVERSKSAPVDSPPSSETADAVADADLDATNSASGDSRPDEATAADESETSDSSGDSWRSESGESWTPSRVAARGADEQRPTDDRAGTSENTGRRSQGRSEQTTAYREPPPERRRDTVQSTRGASTSGSLRAQSDSSAGSGSGSSRGQGTGSSRGQTGREDSGAATRRDIVVDRGSDDVDWADSGDDGSAGEGMRPGEIVGGSTSESRATARDYSKQQLSALGASAARGGLDRDDVDHLKDVPASHKNFTLAWSTVLKDAETKENFRDHCSAAQRIMSLPQNKYHPEWNLEMAKCHLRNRQWPAAVRSVERTLSDSYGMSASTKSKRVLLAHKILAISKTQLYEKNAEANAGLSDDNKLRSAIQAWEHYKTFARGIGNTAALQQADKELADLEGKMN